MRNRNISARVILGILSSCLVQVSVLYAQFSPGPLSKAHEQLEGMQHCAQCHEIGKEISGQKCLACHAEIKAEVEAKHGYHFAVASKQCVVCHKEHLGRDAQTMLFNTRTFDHAVTGFALTGKHGSVACGDCHARKNVRNPDVARILAQFNRTTYLGLNAACVQCHADRHRGTLGVECQSCHTTVAWSPASKFDHSRTKYPLVGKHMSVPCNKCHAGPSQSTADSVVILPAKSFRDCAPCHNSPHSEKFAGQSCSSCHSPQDWRSTRTQQFDHNLTGFKLVGKHATIECQECHKGTSRATFASAFKLPHAKCTDCHVDYHRGEFTQKYGTDCLKCHTQDTFKVTTFTLVAHGQSRFPLSGAHMATPCARCHAAAADGHASFRFASLLCESCHSDAHAGQFAANTGATDCEHCHTTDDWSARKFDHANTRFVLAGKHAATQCKECHKRTRIKGQGVTQYRGVNSLCESCHKEVHAGQFSVNGTTSCQVCHSVQDWTQLVFDHNVQSSFSLAGAHKTVPCRSCHPEEKAGGVSFVRFKPISAKCETCHR